MLNIRQIFGKFGEDLAARHLRKMGYRVICKNYRNRFGEIDIIAKDADTLAFVEVKSRRTKTYGHPKYAVTRAKQEKISKTALYYMKEMGLNSCKARFDVAAVTTAGKKTSVEIVKNAFELAYK